MRLTRDSQLLWFGMAVAVLAFTIGNWDLLQEAFPSMPPAVEKLVTFGAGLLGVVFGIMRASPLDITPEGAAAYRKKNETDALDALGKLDATKRVQVTDAAKQLPPVVLLLALSGALASCATTGGPKPNVVAAYTVTETALGAVQDAERALYAAGTVPALTKAVHEQKVSPLFVAAFDAQIKFGHALLLWKPGTAPPAGYAEWVATVTNTVDALGALMPKNKTLLDTTLAWVRSVAETVRMLGQTVPAPLAALVK